MKKFIAALLVCGSVSAFAEVGDSGQIGIVYVTNSSGEDVKLLSGNAYNDSGYSKFNCFYQVPKKFQDLPSPAFKTMFEPGTKQQKSIQYATIPSGTSAMFAFDSSCDDTNHGEAFTIKSSNNNDKIYVAGVLNQDIKNHMFNYISRTNIHAIQADALGSGNIAPFQVTVLPINQQ